MSIIGKNPIKIPEGVKVTLKGNEVIVEGPKGKLEKSFLDNVAFREENSTIITDIKGKSKFDRSYFGTARQLVNNMVKGVTEGFSKKLKIVGVGYKAAANNDKIILSLGYSHPVEIDKLPNINYEVKDTEIIISGMDKELVGRVAANIKSKRTPDRYKGKGVRYDGEKIKLREGKK